MRLALYGLIWGVLGPALGGAVALVTAILWGGGVPLTMSAFIAIFITAFGLGVPIAVPLALVAVRAVHRRGSSSWVLMLMLALLLPIPVMMATAGLDPSVTDGGVTLQGLVNIWLFLAWPTFVATALIRWFEPRIVQS